MLERIWNGWRADYVVHGQGAQKKSDQSVFTQILNSDMSDEQCYIVHRGEKVFAIMNAFPYTSGHLLVVPYREVAELEDLSQDETSELWATVTDAVKVLKSVYKPEAMNVGINLGAAAGGSIAQHLHVHIVGRWGGDTNFMVTTANTKILPEALDVSADRIRKAWKVK
ncbi:MAG: HIT domain-containing protein [Ilumatobacteraceae bacterium]|nr:HIT domain-containing protein [Ilumatobacteraceae bacterium]